MNLQELESKLDPYWASDSIKSIDVEPGWYQLVLDCHKELLAVNPHYTIVQIKQKFGQLRYYINGNDAMTDNIIYNYENKSVVICERCGDPGSTSKVFNFYMQTLCENHQKGI
jgi:hypothetical protein